MEWFLVIVLLVGALIALGKITTLQSSTISDLYAEIGELRHQVKKLQAEATPSSTGADTNPAEAIDNTLNSVFASMERGGVSHIFRVNEGTGVLEEVYVSQSKRG